MDGLLAMHYLSLHKFQDLPSGYGNCPDLAALHGEMKGRLEDSGGSIPCVAPSAAHIPAPSGQVHTV